MEGFTYEERCGVCRWPEGGLCPGQSSRLACGPGPARPVEPPPPPYPAPDGRLRVAFIGESRAVTGGTETWHDLLSVALDRTNLQVVGWAFRSVAEGRERVPSGEPVGSGPRAMRSLARSCDVLVTWGMADLAEHLPRRGDPSRPLVVAVTHGQAECEYTSHWISSSEVEVDHFVAVSRSCLASIPEPRRSLARVISNAYASAKVVPSRSRAAVRAELGVPDSTPLVLFNGRLAPDKRPLLLLEAAGLARSGFVLALAGSGVQEAEVRAVVQDFGGRTLVLGHRVDTGDLLQAADLLANPSLVEGFGLSMLEAVVAGVPVVASPLGLASEHPSWVRVVPQGSGAAKWAAALDAAVEDLPGERVRAEWARGEAVDRYGPGQFGREWADYLLSVPSPGPVDLPAGPTVEVASIEKPLPGLFTQAKNLAVATMNYMATGGAKVTAEVKSERLAICGSCHECRPSDGRCSACGCYVAIKSQWAGEACPLGKWQPQAVQRARPCRSCGGKL